MTISIKKKILRKRDRKENAKQKEKKTTVTYFIFYVHRTLIGKMLNVSDYKLFPKLFISPGKTV